MSTLPSSVVANMLSFSAQEWECVPPSRKEALRYAHLTAFSAGSLSSCRRALSRLSQWLELNDFGSPSVAGSPCEGFAVSAGLLAWFVSDAQESSRSSGVSVPNALRGGLTFARDHLGLVGLDVRADSFRNVAAPSSVAPVPAQAATVSFMYHFYALMSQTSSAVSYYACGFLLCLLACLCVRDAQRASVHCSDDVVSGCCFIARGWLLQN